MAAGDAPELPPCYHRLVEDSAGGANVCGVQRPEPDPSRPGPAVPQMGTVACRPGGGGLSRAPPKDPPQDRPAVTLHWNIMM